MSSSTLAAAVMMRCFRSFSEWLLPQLQEDSANFISIQDSAPPHWHTDVRNYLDQNLPRRCIGRSTDQYMAVILVTKKSGSNALWFCLVGIYRRQSFVPPLSVSVNDLKQRVTTAAASVDEDMLRCVWNELDYRVDICRVTKGSHTERL
jgi:hypothetical protein